MASKMDVSIIITAIDKASKPFEVINRATRKYAKDVDELDAKLKKISKSMTDFGTKASLGVSLPLFGIGVAAVATSAKFEQLKTDFEIMLGSADKASKLFEKIKQFSASTPFQLDGLAENTKKLLAFGIEEENVLVVMRKLGDTAGGNSEKLATLVDVYGKVAAGGKASMEDINRVTDAGVPILQVLAKQLGVTVSTLREDLIPAGKISQEVFDQAFTSMTEKGGMFYKGMEKQSQTLNGLLSTFKDNMTNVLGTLGDTITKTFDLKGKLTSITVFMIKFNGFIERNPELVKMAVSFGAFLAITGPLIVALGILASSLGSIIAFVPRFIFFVGLMKKWQIATKLMAAAQWLLNIALNANPIGLLVIGIIALVSWGYVLYKSWEPFRNLIDGIADKIKGVAGFFGGKAPAMPVAESAGAVPKYDVGSTGITKTGLAIVHQGEKILPAGRSGGGSTIIHYSPNLTITGADANSVNKIKQIMKESFNECIRDYQHNLSRRSFV